MSIVNGHIVSTVSAIIIFVLIPCLIVKKFSKHGIKIGKIEFINTLKMSLFYEKGYPNFVDKFQVIISRLEDDIIFF